MEEELLDTGTIQVPKATPEGPGEGALRVMEEIRVWEGDGSGGAP